MVSQSIRAKQTDSVFLIILGAGFVAMGASAARVAWSGLRFRTCDVAVRFALLLTLRCRTSVHFNKWSRA
jgi:hypothetical protein